MQHYLPKPGDIPTVIEKGPLEKGNLSSENAPEAAHFPATFSREVQDLRHDPLLAQAPRVEFHGREVPSLGGVPLLAKVGHGGMGAVYLGVHPRLKQEVAIKVLPLVKAELNPELIQRFFREAQMAVRVDSPNIIRVLDVNEERQTFFLIMEYVDGPSAGAHLRALKKEGKSGLAEDDALKIVLAASTGLAAAHVKAIVHRDVKPDNIIIPQSNGELAFESARLADLGLGRCEALGHSLTLANASLGTPGFMSPEQVTNAKVANKTSDIFGMGATLYALLSGNAPFHRGTPIEVILQTVQDAHVPILDVCPQVSRPTAELIEICLDKRASERFADGPVLLDALKICRDVAGKSAQAQNEAIAKVKVLSQVKTAESVRLASTAFYRPVRRALLKCVLSKVCIAVAVVLCVAGFLRWRSHEFVAARENVLNQVACAQSPMIDDIVYGIGMLEAFVRENSSRAPEELAPVTDRICKLRVRQAKLEVRRKRFEQLLSESAQKCSADPDEARRILDKAATIGAADGAENLPDLLSSAVPDLPERRAQIDAALRRRVPKDVRAEVVN